MGTMKTMKKTNMTFKRSALSSAILCAMGSAHAATITVDSNCSLVEAMQTANSDLPVGTCIVGNGDDIIQVVTENDRILINTVFELSDATGYVGLPIVTSNMTIEGNGVTVSADNSVDKFRIFEVGLGGDLTLRDTIVTGADDGVGAGSGLLAYEGRVSIENSTFALNNSGVLIASSYNNVINNSVFRHNINSSYGPGGLQTYFAEVDINKSSFIENEFSYDGSLRSQGGGGGVINIAGGAALFNSDVTITDSTFSGNKSIYGGGITISNDTSLAIASKSIRFGDSPLRGIISSNTQITNSTLTNNQALIAGGILDVGYDSEITLQGSIISGNTNIPGGFAPNIYRVGNSTINLDANNIIGDNGSTGSINITLGSSDSSFSNYAEDNLYPLSLSNGQLVHPLKVGSSAIDANDLSCYGSTNDQEGKGRGKDGDDDGSFICDIGAFEHTLPIIADGAPCTFVNALESAENDASVGGCQPGKGHDIIVLEENSVQTFNAVVDMISTNYYSIPFGIAGIETAVTLESNGSTFNRDAASLDSFDLFYIEPGGQLNLIDATVTGANGMLGAVTTWYGGNVNVLNSVITGNQSAAVFDVFSFNSSVVDSEISQNSMSIAKVNSSFSPLTTLRSAGFEIRRSTVSGNIGSDASGGVDFRNVSLAALENSTVSGNTANNFGGMIITPNYYGSLPAANIRHSTLTGNSGYSVGGIFVTSYGSINSSSMSHSIVSGNELLVAPPATLSNTVNNSHFLGGRFVLPENRGGGPTASEIDSQTPYFTLNANNIIGQNNDSGSVGITTGASDIVPVGATNTVIDTTLADNGGATLTHLPLDAGIAVDGGDSNCELNTDQTGRIRPWDGDGDGDAICDIGSVELGSIYASDIIFKDGFDPLIILRRQPVTE